MKTPEMKLPDLTTYRVLHRGMRADAARLTAAVAGITEKERTTRGATLGRWYGGYFSELHDHHTAEDEIFFPAILERLPVFDSQITRIDEEHARLDDMLEWTRTALAKVADPGVDWPVAHAEANEATGQLRRLLDTHLTFEDNDVLPLFVAHFSAEDYDGLGEKAMERVDKGHLKFAIPWIMEAAYEDERRKLKSEAPLAFKLLWYATRGRYARMAREAFGADQPPAGELPKAA